MEIATGAISALLPKLGNLLKEEYKLQRSVRDDIIFLQAELEAMQTALFKISSAPIDHQPDAQINLWAREVRELSYDLEDNIDRFLVRIDHAPEQFHGLSLRGFIGRSINFRQIGKEIKGIKIRIREVSERYDRYNKIDNVTAKPTRPSVDSLRLSALHKKASELIGTERKVNYLEKMLLEDNEFSNRQLKIVSIVGMGGLGKTTLANEVYKKLKAQFDCEAFVTVSLNPNMDQVLKSMLRQLDEDKYKNINGEMWDEQQLINELRCLLKNKRYLIVVDDIWNKSVWANILRALNKCGRGSRIIITTRILDVAEQTDNIYRLEPLSAVDSRKLFFLRIFGTENRCLPNDLDKESDNILKKCGGVPLAIITISSMLASKKEAENTSEYWAKVCKSMGSGLENTSSDVNDMRSILSVSYHDLPLHLRTCLLYLSLYPEDYEIMTHDLIWKWIGEGFVAIKQGMDMFEAGEDYVHELINRSLIMPRFDDKSKKAISFQIHDMVLDLITYLSNEQHFLTKLGAQEPEHLPNKIRRLSLHTSNKDDGKRLGNKNCSHVRSLTVFHEASDILQEISRFPVLRQLDLAKAQVGNHHFKDICNLFHLRYLRLPNTGITEIPKEIGNLKFLQVLDMHWTNIVELPSTFAQLRQLVYLRFGVLIPDTDMFGYINLKSPTMLDILGGLTELRRVSLAFTEWDERYEKPLLTWFSNMFFLKYLHIDGTVSSIDLGSRCDELSSPGLQQLQTILISCAICSIPRWISSLCSLSIMCISLLTLRLEDLHILGNLPRLSDLSITVKETAHSREKGLLVIGNVHPFLCLTKFEIYNNYMAVMFAEGAMQQLQTLKFSVRESMDQFGNSGFGLENLSSLEHIIVDMVLSGAKPEEVEATKAEIQKAVDINPNKPELKFEKRVILRIKSEDKTKAFRAVSGIYGIDAISFERHIGMLTVAGTVELELATIIKKLKKSSIQALPWDVRSPTVSLARTSVEEAAPIPNSTLRRSLIFRVWDRICSLQLRVQDCFHPSMP